MVDEMTGGMGMAASALGAVVENLAGDLSTEHLLQVDRKKLIGGWVREVPDHSNHDLFMALRDSIKDAVSVTSNDYLRSPASDDNEYHRSAVLGFVDRLEAEIDASFDKKFWHELDEEEVIELGEVSRSPFAGPLQAFLSEKELREFGPIFSEYFINAFPGQLTVAFTHHLKTNERAWVAYNRRLLLDAKISLHRNTELSEEVLMKLDKFSQQLEVVEKFFEGPEEMALMAMRMSPEIANCHELSLARFDQVQKQVANFQLDLKRKLEELLQQSDDQYVALEKNQMTLLAEVRMIRDELNVKLDKKVAEDQAYLNEVVLPKYLDCLIQKYKTIKLPSIDGDVEAPEIPLDHIYVALQLLDEQARQEMLFRSAALEEALKEEEQKDSGGTNKEISRAKLLQQNPEQELLSNFEASGSQQAGLHLAQAISDYRYQVILGDPGSGKSTLSRWLMLKMALAIQAKQSDRLLLPLDQLMVVDAKTDQERSTFDAGPLRLPVMIRISEYAKFYHEFTYDSSQPEQGRGIVDFLRFHIRVPEVTSDSLDALLRSYLQQGKALVILDGLDEIVIGRSEILEEVKFFVAEWIDGGNRSAGIPSTETPLLVGGNQLVATSRIIGYSISRLPSRFAELYVDKMSDEAIRQFSQVWFRAVMNEEEELALKAFEEEQGLQPIMLSNTGDNEKADPDSIENPEKPVFQSPSALAAAAFNEGVFDPARPQVRELATNPLLITILALLYRFGNGSLPKTRVSLYYQAVNILIRKWRPTRGERITPSEILAILPPIAAFIHESPSEDITEIDLQAVLRGELLDREGISRDKKPPLRLERKVESLITKFRDDVGLISERGPKLYHFLHRTFQEYLAGIEMIQDKSVAASKIVEKIADPVWREPILLALGYANKFWQLNDFEDFVEDIRKADEQLGDLVPRTVLLIAQALPEMERISDSLFRDIMSSFLEVYSHQRFIDGGEAVLKQVREVIRRVREGGHRQRFYAFCQAHLQEGSYNDTHFSMIDLAAAEGWGDANWLCDLIEHQAVDRADWDWAIDRLCHQLIKDKNWKLVECETLRFRNRLLARPEWMEHLSVNIGWMRLVSVLYGGWPSDPEKMIADFHRLERYRSLFLSGRVDMDNEGFSYAVSLDTEGGLIDSLYKGFHVIVWKQIHRETPFTNLLLRALSRKQSSESLIPDFRDIWESGAETEERSLALLALAALGENVQRIVFRKQIDDTDSEVIDRFLSHLKRVNARIEPSLIRLNCILRRYPATLAKEGLQYVGHQHKGFLTRVFSNTFAKAGLPPVEMTTQVEGRKTWFIPAKGENRQIVGLIEVFAWINRIGSFTFDPIRTLKKYLKDNGDALAGENGQLLFETLLSLPLQIVERNQHYLQWDLPKIPFPLGEDEYKALFVLRVINGIPNKFGFVKFWMIQRLWSVFWNYESCRPLAAIILLGNDVNNEAEAYLKQQWPALMEGDQPWAKLTEAIEKIEDAYVRFISIVMMPFWRTTTLLRSGLLPSMLSIKNPSAWFDAFDQLMGVQFLELKTENSPRIVLMVPSAMMSLGEADGKLLGDYMDLHRANINDRFTRAYMEMMILYRFLTEEDRLRAFAEMLDDLPTIEDEGLRSNFLRLILQQFGSYSRTYPSEKWEELNRSFTNRNYLNFALEKDYLNLFTADTLSFFEKKENINGRNFMVLFGLARMCQQIQGRFQERDPVAFHALKLREARTRNEGLAYFQKEHCDGLPLSRELSSSLRALAEDGAISEMKALAALLDLNRGGDLDVAHEFSISSVNWLKDFYCLLQAEAGILNENITKVLLQFMDDEGDRLRLRAAEAIAGNFFTYVSRNRAFSLSSMTFEEAYCVSSLLYNKKYSCYQTSTLYRIFHNIDFDNPDIIHAMIDDIEENGLYRNPAEMVVREVFYPNKEVIDVLFDRLETTPKREVGELLWRSIAKVTSRTLLDGERKYLKYRIQRALKNDNATQHLSTVRFAITHADHLTNLLVDSAEKIDLPQEIEQKAKAHFENFSHISFKEYTPENLHDKLAKLGDLQYIDIVNAEYLVNQGVKKTAGKPAVLQALLNWIFPILEDELLDGRMHDFLGSGLILSLSEAAKLYPDTLRRLITDKQKNILAECLQEHPSWVVRRATVVILCKMQTISATILKSLILAMRDVQEVRETVKNNVKLLTKLSNKNTMEILRDMLFSPRGTEAEAALLMLQNLGKDPAFPAKMREEIVSIVTKSLRQELAVTANRRLIYKTVNSPLTNKPIFVDTLETKLYEALISFSGVDLAK